MRSMKIPELTLKTNPIIFGKVEVQFDPEGLKVLTIERCTNTSSSGVCVSFNVLFTYMMNWWRVGSRRMPAKLKLSLK